MPLCVGRVGGHNPAVGGYQEAIACSDKKIFGQRLCRQGGHERAAVRQRRGQQNEVAFRRFRRVNAAFTGAHIGKARQIGKVAHFAVGAKGRAGRVHPGQVFKALRLRRGMQYFAQIFRRVSRAVQIGGERFKMAQPALQRHAKMLGLVVRALSDAVEHQPLDFPPGAVCIGQNRIKHHDRSRKQQQRYQRQRADPSLWVRHGGISPPEISHLPYYNAYHNFGERP